MNSNPKTFRLALLLAVWARLLVADTFTEDFSSPPAGNGWRIFGDTNLFHWDSTNQNLAVTWDSSHSNSYFHHPLSTILARDDDFQLGFDLQFTDYAIAVTPGKPNTFPVAIGFLNLAQATLTNFSRGTGVNATYGPKNLVEFNFFPAFSSFLPTIDQVIVSTNNSWLYNHDNLLEMSPGNRFHIAMNYLATSRTLTTVVSNNATQYGQTQTITVPASFDFRVASVSISSYNDQRSQDSLLAHGSVDNLVVVTPPPAVQNFTGELTNGIWQARFVSRTNFLYTLERMADYGSWTNASPAALGNQAKLILTDPNPPFPVSGTTFYRVRAERP